MVTEMRSRGRRVRMGKRELSKRREGEQAGGASVSLKTGMLPGLHVDCERPVRTWNQELFIEGYECTIRVSVQRGDGEKRLGERSPDVRFHTVHVAAQRTVADVASGHRPAGRRHPPDPFVPLGMEGALRGTHE